MATETKPQKPSKAAPSAAHASTNQPSEWMPEGSERTNPPYFFWKPTIEEKNEAEGTTVTKRNPVQGIILSRGQRPWSNNEEDYQKELAAGTPGEFVVVYCTKAGTIITGHDKTQPPRISQIGDIIWIDLRFDLKTLGTRTPVYDATSNALKGMYWFGAVPERKEKIKGGKEVWKFDVRGKWLYTSDPNCPKLPEIVNASDLAWESENDPHRQLPPNAEAEFDGGPREPF
jgi:hypothetical protein